MRSAPWLDNYGEVPHTLDYFEGTMYEAVKNIADKYPNATACDFMGKKTSYTTLVKKIRVAARALLALGVKKGDAVTLCMPNCPQTVVMLYAVNLVGAVAAMIHPLSAQKEIEFYLSDSGSSFAVTLDQFAYKFDNTDLKALIVTSVKDELPPLKKLLYPFTERKKPQKPRLSVVPWHSFLSLAGGATEETAENVGCHDGAVILYSGGTTGTTKGILLSSYNFNALSKQIIATNPMFRVGDKMLAVMPVFHGFGLGVSIHSMLANGGRCVLVPRFTAKSYAKLIKSSRCNYIAGVPTLFEALIRQKSMKNADLSHLKGVFSGGDTLPCELKKRFDNFLKDRNSTISIREGYGTTECVTASCLTPIHLAKEGSIGQPFPDMYYKIVKPGTETQLPYGEEGEICISGPTVMLCYINNEKETADTLRLHSDGYKWVHTGDLGVMDCDGFVYFRQRIKRMIVTSGYNVYPSRLEKVLDAHPLVELSCVIGVPDPIKMQRIKAFVVLARGAEKSDKTKESIMEHLRLHLAKYSLPYAIEFRDELPKTLVGKVAYRELEKQESEKNNNQ